MTYHYKAELIRQTPSSAPIVLFAAPASEINEWVGIPQRRRVGDFTDDAVESVGFQREDRPARVAEIARFMSNPQNVIQNPLLGAIQVLNEIEITEDGTEYCELRITPRDHTQRTLLELLREVSESLVKRMPVLGQRAVQQDRLFQVRSAVTESASDLNTPAESAVSENEDFGASEDEAQDAAVALFDEETQVIDFFDQVNARVTVLEEIGDAGTEVNSIAGFSRDFLESMIKPVVLVDGQHRLRGALEAMDEFLGSPIGQERSAQLIDQGSEPEEAERQLRHEHDRQLPVSLLYSDNPAEHVFQYVVVNQKATPMSSALLGTIVSTSLSKDELEPIAERLRDAGIELEDSRAVAYLTRSPDSPFRNLVSTGVRGDRPGALQWSVLRKLVNIVRNLQDGALFHMQNIDYARMWRNKYLASTGLLSADLDSDERLAAWAAADGP